MLVWRFEDAPDDLRAISVNGGDEDWLAELPPSYTMDYIPWLEYGSFGCCCIDKYFHPSKPGWMVVIGSHA